MRSVFAGLHSSKKRGGLDEAPQFASRMHVRRDGAMFLKANLARCKKKAGGRGGGGGGLGWRTPPIGKHKHNVSIMGSERVHMGSGLQCLHHGF